MYIASNENSAIDSPFTSYNRYTIIHWYIISTICPTGVSVARGKLTIRIFRGEDFPQLDPSMPKVKKGNTEVDHVDPYCIVSFAGHKHLTPVISNDYDPKWNVELSFPFTVS